MREKESYVPVKRQLVEDIQFFLRYAGCRYWTASLLPALVGTTLPFWLRPSGFSFHPFTAIEFLLATVWVHSGFSLLLAYVEGDKETERCKPKLLKYASGFIITACFLGLHINSGLKFHYGVPKNIFIIYGVVTLIVGTLYVVPPINLNRRMGREIVIAEGLGMIPVLGAYLVQVGDITRAVYLASMPMVVTTGLWVWLEELASKIHDEKTSRNTLVIDFGLKFSARFGVLTLVILFFGTLIVSEFTSSTPPLTFIALLLAGFAWKIVSTSWNMYSRPEQMNALVRSVFRLHLITGFIFAASSLLP